MSALHGKARSINDEAGALRPWCGRFTACVISLLAGLALPLAFAPTEWIILAPLAIVILYGAIHARSPRDAALIGWLFGVGYFGIGVHWVYHSLHIFGGAAELFAGLITVVFVVVMTLFPLAVCYAFARLSTPRAWLGNVWLFAALWVLAELLRNSIMGGFPWLLLGYAQTSSLLGELAPVVGVYGISFLVIVASLSAVEALLLRRRGPRWLAALSVMAIVLGAWYAGRTEFSQPKSNTLGVRLAQANIAQEMKFSRERLKRSLDEYLALTETDLGPDIDLVVWPETAIPTDFSNVEDYIAPTIARLDARGIDVLAGGFDRDGDDSYNSVRQLGGQRQMYRKRHIVPFGEYLPLRGFLEIFSAFIHVPGSDLSRGDGPHVPMFVAGEGIGVSICYEDVFGEEMRPLLPASTLLVNVSNDAWFGNSAAPHQHEQKARMRAREMGRPMIRVTNTGVSSAIRYDGSVIDRIPHGVMGVLDVQIQPRVGTTPYVTVGNWPALLLSVLLVMFAVWRRGQHVMAPKTVGS